MPALYVLKNIVNKKMYIGQTIDLIKRMRVHESPTTDKSYIDRAMNKHNRESFELHVFYIPEELLDYFEIEMIKRLNTLVPNGYNVLPGGLVARNYHPTKKARKNMSMAHIGKKHPKKIKTKMSIAQKGKHMGINNFHAKTIICTETKKIYGSIREAERKTNINSSNISQVALGNRETAGDYHWRFV